MKRSPYILFATVEIGGGCTGAVDASIVAEERTGTVGLGLGATAKNDDIGTWDTSEPEFTPNEKDTKGDGEWVNPAEVPLIGAGIGGKWKSKKPTRLFKVKFDVPFDEPPVIIVQPIGNKTLEEGEKPTIRKGNPERPFVRYKPTKKYCFVQAEVGFSLMAIEP